MASRSYKEARHAVAAGGGYKVGTVGLNLNGNVSSEPDYLSQTIGGATSTRARTTSSSRRASATISRAIASASATRRSVSSSATSRRTSSRRGITFVMSPTTLLVTGVTVQIERGEESKLYRYVPMFSPERSRAKVGPVSRSTT